MPSSPPPHQPLHIAILGASISGLALAIGLSKHHISYTLYEASPTLNAIGAGIAFGPNALRAMSLLDPRFKAAYDKIATGNSSKGKEHVFHDLLLCEPGFGLVRGWAGASVEYACYAKSSCHRKELLDVMSALVPVERIVFGKRAVRVSQGGGKASITFADGTSVEADAVVGCDGGRSVVRKAVLESSWPEDVDASYAERYVYRAVVPMEDAEGILGEYAGDGKMFVGPGRYFATYQMAGGTQVNIVAGRQDDKPWTQEQWTKTVMREEMLEDFEGCDSRLLKLLDYAKPIRWSLHHHLSTPTYFNKLICLLGDAAHACTPHQGAGAGQCLEDAVILSYVLSLVSDPQSHPVDIQHAFESYNCVRKPRAQRVVKTSDEAGKMYCFEDERCRSDVEKIVASARERFGRIWEVNLWEEVQRAGERFIGLQEEYGGDLRL